MCIRDSARTAASALKAEVFDLVLLDINLPDGSGYDLCRLLKPKYPDTVVIFLTANDQECDQIRGYEAGAVDYITKPFSIGALQRKISAMFAMLEHHKPAKDIYDDGRLSVSYTHLDVYKRQGFHDIIICPGLKAADFIRRLHPRRQK